MINYKRRYKLSLLEFQKLQAAAQKVIDDTNKNLDTKESPVRYGAPYGALADLAKLLAKQYGCK